MNMGRCHWYYWYWPSSLQHRYQEHLGPMAMFTVLTFLWTWAIDTYLRGTIGTRNTYDSWTSSQLWLLSMWTRYWGHKFMLSMEYGQIAHCVWYIPLRKYEHLIPDSHLLNNKHIWTRFIGNRERVLVLISNHGCMSMVTISTLPSQLLNVQTN